MTENWYVVRSHPHKEEFLWRQVLRRGFDVFYPRMRVDPVNPRARKILPYFPGYLFFHTDLEQVGYSVMQYMPYSTGLVSFGGDPASVPDSFINSLRNKLGKRDIANYHPESALEAGDKVFIQDGPFKGYEALFDLRISGSDRVRVLLQMLSERVVPLELRSNQIQKISNG
jgi:transcription antitermination factor NusG